MWNSERIPTSEFHIPNCTCRIRRPAALHRPAAGGRRLLAGLEARLRARQRVRGSIPDEKGSYAMLWKGFQRPKRLEFERETLTDRFGRFYAQPFARGF